MVMVMKEEMRKGPWTEDEDVQLMCFVRLFGERRWDFIAKVSGLQRTGKSCRLRWVNYLNPDLKRGRMTPQEERQVLELHARWGNRWSRIARRLPGRTDNEIKNYWRTHMRKKAQEGKKAAATLPTLSSSSSSSTLSTSPAFCPSITNLPPDHMHHELKGPRQPPGPTPEATSMITTAAGSVVFKSELEEEVKAYPMEQIWEEIASSSSEHHQRQRPHSTLPWDYSCYTSDYSCCTSDPLWKMSGTVGIKEDAVPMIDNHGFLHPELPTSSLF